MGFEPARCIDAYVYMPPPPGPLASNTRQARTHAPLLTWQAMTMGKMERQAACTAASEVRPLRTELRERSVATESPPETNPPSRQPRLMRCHL